MLSGVLKVSSSLTITTKINNMELIIFLIFASICKLSEYAKQKGYK